MSANFSQSLKGTDNTTSQMYKKNHKKTCNKKNKKLRMKTVLCDGLNDAAQQLIVVDDVEQMKCKEVTVKHDPTDRHCHKHLHTHTHTTELEQGHEKSTLGESSE